eukprot:227753-Amphidinium_carterae.1
MKTTVTTSHYQPFVQCLGKTLSNVNAQSNEHCFRTVHFAVESQLDVCMGAHIVRDLSYARHVAFTGGSLPIK